MWSWTAGWLTWLRRVAPERLLLVALALAALILWWAAWRAWPRQLEVVALSVGDGDAYLIRAPSGQCVLWDGGSRSLPDVGRQVLTPNLLLLGVQRLDAVILSHPDSDHVNGLPDVLEALPTRMVLDPELPNESTPYQSVVEICKARDIPRYRLRAGECVRLGRRVRLRILTPGLRLLAGTSSDTNNNCVVGLLEYGRTRMLFTGDLEAEGEQALLARAAAQLQADVLTVAHHGSRTGTNDTLLAAVRPHTAIISSRGDQHGTHPHRDVLRRLRAHGIKILRTDVHGQIRLTSDGNTWRVATYRPAADIGTQ